LKIEIEKATPKFLIIDHTSFKYSLGAELDKFMDAKDPEGGGEITISKRDMDRLYFEILERLEPYFREAPQMEPLNEIIKKLQPSREK